MTQIQFGAGAISPKVAAHLQRSAKPKVQTGGGSVSPKIFAHLQK